MSETWRVIDEAGAVHEVESGRVGDSASWWARVRQYEASVVHDSARAAVVVAAVRDGVAVAEVLAPGERSRGFREGAEAMRGAVVAAVTRRAEQLDASEEATEIAFVLAALPLPGEEVPRG